MLKIRVKITYKEFYSVFNHEYQEFKLLSKINQNKTNNIQKHQLSTTDISNKV